MKVKCIANSGDSIINFARQAFTYTEMSKFGLVKVGQEYLTMGMIMINGSLVYVVDSNSTVGCVPAPLFEIIDNKLDPNWHFNLTITKENDIRDVISIWGYYELCFEKDHIYHLINGEEKALNNYFEKKILYEKYLEDQ